jgi:hypothetical protein
MNNYLKKKRGIGPIDLGASEIVYLNVLELI